LLLRPAGAAAAPVGPNEVANSRHAAGILGQPVAMLGYWRDCNADDYVGSAALRASDYPVGGVSTSICGPGSAYNDGIFIHEFLPIGPNPSMVWGVNDTAAIVWADWASPEEPFVSGPRKNVTDERFEFNPMDGFWYGRARLLTLEDRMDLGIMSHAYLTTYANTSVASSSGLPSGFDEYRYGSSFCGDDIGSGELPQNGWQCDPALWQDETTLVDCASSTGQNLCPKVGRRYELRDVNCYDNRNLVIEALPDPLPLLGGSAAIECEP
jgi:hypothetical protein